MRRLTSSVALVLAAATTGCLAEGADDGDPADETFLTEGKGDGAIAEGTPEAYGVLQLVNNGSYAQLKSTGISGSALANIEKHRLGADGLAYSSDDGGFGSLAQLDAVKYVGATTFNRLLAYARSNGYVSPLPFAESTCADRFTSFDRMAEASNNFQEEVFGGALWAHTRDCRGTVCTEWYGLTKLGQPDDTWIEFANAGDKVQWLVNYHRLDKGHTDAGTPVDSVTSFEWTLHATPDPLTMEFSSGQGSHRLGDQTLTKKFEYTGGFITDTCLRTTGSLMYLDGDIRVEDEYVFVTEL